MAITVLPLDATAPAYTVDVDLSGTVYRLRVEWDTRWQAWILGIGLTTGEVIADGQALRSDWEPFAAIVDQRMPAGTIFCLDLDGAGDPAFEDLGERIVVLYDDGE